MLSQHDFLELFPRVPRLTSTLRRTRIAGRVRLNSLSYHIQVQWAISGENLSLTWLYPSKRSKRARQREAEHEIKWE